MMPSSAIIHSLVTYSPASESLALEFLSQVQKIWGVYGSGISPHLKAEGAQ